MTFTALHRALGLPPGPITNDLLDEAVTAHTEETDGLDWKSNTLPPPKGLPQHDFPKDVAAMANSGGGLIVYGVTEKQKAATGRDDVGELSEVHERALHSAAVTAISPPVFGLIIHRLVNEAGKRAVVVEVPASVDGPHLIYRNDYFGAPIRNNADTVWMKEREIEALYRARFDERRRATDALNALFGEASAGRDTASRAWLVAVAHPRIPRVNSRLSRDDARAIVKSTEQLALAYAGRHGRHPLEVVDRNNPRPGLRRWVTAPRYEDWREVWASVHHDGSVTLAAAIGGRRLAMDEYAGGGDVDPCDVEGGVADFMALTRATAEATGNGEYDVRVGINWTGSGSVTMLRRDSFSNIYDGGSLVPSYTPVEATVNAAASDGDFAWDVYHLALDCVNQCGEPQPRMVKRPPEEEAGR